MKFWEACTWPWIKKETLFNGKPSASSRGLSGCCVWVCCRRGKFFFDVTDGYDHITSLPIDADSAVLILDRIESSREARSERL